MIKDILTLLDLNSDTPAQALAVDLASKANAHLTGVAPVIEPIMPGYVAGPIPGDVLEHARQQSEDAARVAAKRFEDYAAKQGISAEPRMFSLASGGGSQAFISHCRVTDAVVIGQDNPDEPQPLRSALIEAALFDGSAPLLLVPYIGASAFKAGHVMVAWDGSKTAARTVHGALPILEMAERIDVVIVGDPPALAGEPGADLAVYLARHDLSVEVRRVSKGSSRVSDVILNYVSDNGIDMAVMGGYGHSRVREFILGGATKGMLELMTVPVLMTH